MKEKERIAFEMPASTYRVLRQLMIDLDFKTVADVVRHLMKESPEIQDYMQTNKVDLDFGSGRWGGRREPSKE